VAAVYLIIPAFNEAKRVDATAESYSLTSPSGPREDR
jgi:hypothetical protein